MSFHNATCVYVPFVFKRSNTAFAVILVVPGCAIIENANGPLPLLKDKQMHKLAKLDHRNCTTSSSGGLIILSSDCETTLSFLCGVCALTVIPKLKVNNAIVSTTAIPLFIKFMCASLI